MFVALLLGGLGCAGGVVDPDPARQALIVETLIGTDRDLIAQRPELVAGKYAKMAESLQGFLRGTAALWYRDHTRLLGDETTLHGAGAELVQLFGDSHLENTGASFDEQGMLVECTDFDATMAAPFDWEVRRAGLGLAVLLATVELDSDREDAALAAAVEALASGWLDAVTAAASGTPAAPLRPGALGVIYEAALGKARQRRDARDELATLTRIDDNGARVMVRDGVDLGEVSAPFDRGLDAALVLYRAHRCGGPVADGYLSVKDVVRKYHSGVSSFANLRFDVLIEGDSGAPDDDLILELKEERDPPLPSGLLGRGPAQPSNAARVVAGSRLLLSSPGVDADLGWTGWHGVSFQVRRETGGRRNLKVADLAADLATGRLTVDDVAVMARVMGTLIGAAHARGGDPVALLRVAGEPSAFQADTVAAARRDLTRLIADLTLFRAALDERGPLLGVRP